MPCLCSPNDTNLPLGGVLFDYTIVGANFRDNKHFPYIDPSSIGPKTMDYQFSEHFFIRRNHQQTNILFFQY